jgi:hypothetical protein
MRSKAKNEKTGPIRVLYYSGVIFMRISVGGSVLKSEEMIKREAAEAWIEIDRIIMRVKAEQQAAGRELDELNRKMPKMLLGTALGTIARSEVRELKIRMSELREIINDTPIIINELEREKRLRCFNPLQDACFLTKGRERYNTLKERIAEGSESSLEELRRWARDIDEEDDCEQFIAAVCGAPADRK